MVWPLFEELYIRALHWVPMPMPMPTYAHGCDIIVHE